MKSILYQLKKYNPAPNNIDPLIVFESEAEKGGDDTWRLACAIVDSQYDVRNELWERAVKHVASLLADMPPSPFAGILFSREIQGIYHCYYNHCNQVASEGCTDRFFVSFLRSVNPSEYQRKFEDSVDDITKKLVIIRVALATSESNTLNVTYRTTNSYGTTYTNPKKEDILPLEFRWPAFEYLGVKSISEVADLQERLTKNATVDQIILGRMGYMMFWSWNNRSDGSDIPLLPAPAPQLLPPI
jgi:hypothetical protein